MEVYVIRHTPVAVGKDICYGQSDVPLADSFTKDAAYYRDQLPTDFDVVFCSPSYRCKLLSEVLQCENIIFENAIREMNFGDWENKNWNDLNQYELNTWMADFVHIKTPNGECLLDLFDRVCKFLNNLRDQPYQKVLLITHAGVIRCIWSFLLEIPLQNVFKIPVGYHEIFIFNLTLTIKTDSIKRIL
ncbi:MAG: alpha-ribazole phosphatase family protein [Thermaurantimonas sp.]